MKRKTFELLKVYSPFLVVLISIILGGTTLKIYQWFKNYSDFATTQFVLEAKADCYKQVDIKIAEHENKDSEQYKELSRKIDQIYIILIQGRK